MNLQIANVCSTNAVYKRKIEKIKLSIYKSNKKIATFNFNDGLWMPSQSKFFLRRELAFTNGCLKGSKAITLNLAKNFLNSTDGLYFNLNSGNKIKINCPELSNI